MNNNLLYNAALVAAATAPTSGTFPTGAPAAGALAAAVALATAVDTAIPNDTLISAGGGGALPPTTAAITDAQASKTALIGKLVGSAVAGRYSQAVTGYGPLATIIAAEYTAVVADLVTG